MNSAKTVLLIEDDPFISKVLRLRLEDARILVLQAFNGEEATELLTKLKSKPDLVLCDIAMPKKSGLEVLEWMKAQPELKDIPVMMLTNLGQETDMEKAKSLGAIAYFVKTKTSLDELAVTIKEYLDKKSIPADKA